MNKNIHKSFLLILMGVILGLALSLVFCRHKTQELPVGVISIVTQQLLLNSEPKGNASVFVFKENGSILVNVVSSREGRRYDRLYMLDGDGLNYRVVDENYVFEDNGELLIYCGRNYHLFWREIL